MKAKDILERTDSYLDKLDKLEYRFEHKTLCAMKELWQNMEIESDEMDKFLDDIETVCFRCIHGVDRFKDCEKCEEIITKYHNNVYSK